MQTQNNHNAGSIGWLGFELSVLHRLKFKSVALPLAGEPGLGLYLKRWNARVAANDPAQWAWTKSQAFIENNCERLTEADLEIVLDDAYVPRNYFRNPTLLTWFNETDAWWFDNVRANAERLSSPYKRALALALGMGVGDYVFSFNLDTRDLRQPLSLSNVFRRVWHTLMPPVNNLRQNSSSNQSAKSFLAETQNTDLLFMRLPRPTRATDSRNARVLTWREEWIRQSKSFWSELSKERNSKLDAYVETKEQYLGLIEDLMHTAAHLPQWAIEAVSDGFVTTDELVECVSNTRKIDAIYTKDFSELLGIKAVIITAVA
ncbi:MAG: hypothetical protein AUJ04_08320 [Acidobacteria bacterium 13_1_40CM_3_55_6]|nr:MAG: hypothetical protein AUJ04_08320 [Acidobacteria bacterium 13_1_40CM_3_55_6]PYS60895.1 MAG: hypothetical protein DMF74_17535 [Acidobacteriota bacterium]